MPWEMWSGLDNCHHIYLAYHEYNTALSFLYTLQGQNCRYYSNSFFVYKNTFMVGGWILFKESYCGSLLELLYMLESQLEHYSVSFLLPSLLAFQFVNLQEKAGNFPSKKAQLRIFLIK